MDAESIAAGAAIGSLFLSVVAVGVSIWLHNASESGRRLWEIDQDTKKHGWEQDLQDRQNKWQINHDQKLRDWEHKLRQPQLQIKTEYALHPWALGVQTLVLSTAINIGIVPVRIQSGGQIILPDGRVMDFPLKETANSSLKYGYRHDVTRPLEPGDSFSAYWELNYLRDQLQNSGVELENYPLQSRWTDKLGNNHDSEKCPLLLGDDEDKTDDRTSTRLDH